MQHVQTMFHTALVNGGVAGWPRLEFIQFQEAAFMAIGNGNGHPLTWEGILKTGTDCSVCFSERQRQEVHYLQPD